MTPATVRRPAALAPRARAPLEVVEEGAPVVAVPVPTGPPTGPPAGAPETLVVVPVVEPPLLVPAATAPAGARPLVSVVATVFSAAAWYKEKLLAAVGLMANTIPLLQWPT